MTFKEYVNKELLPMLVIERGENSWGADVPDLPGCVAVGETREEVLQLIRWRTWLLHL